MINVVNRFFALIICSMYFNLNAVEHSSLTTNLKSPKFDLELKMNTVVDSHSLYWGGTETVNPELVVGTVVFRVNNEVIQLPKSLFADLADIKSCTFTLVHKTVLLKLSGGGAASAYEALIAFGESGLVISKRVWLSSFPDSTMQTTTFKTNPLD